VALEKAIIKKRVAERFYNKKASHERSIIEKKVLCRYIIEQNGIQVPEWRCDNQNNESTHNVYQIFGTSPILGQQEVDDSTIGEIPFMDATLRSPMDDISIDDEIDRLVDRLHEEEVNRTIDTPSVIIDTSSSRSSRDVEVISEEHNAISEEHNAISEEVVQQSIPTRPIERIVSTNINSIERMITPTITDERSSINSLLNPAESDREEGEIDDNQTDQEEIENLTNPHSKPVRYIYTKNLPTYKEVNTGTSESSVVSSEASSKTSSNSKFSDETNSDEESDSDSESDDDTVKNTTRKRNIISGDWHILKRFPKYVINKQGVVRHAHQHSDRYIKKQYKNKRGAFVNIPMPNKHGNIAKLHCYVHDLLAATFIKNDNPKVYKYVKHIDKNIYNNTLTNLRWSQYKLRINYGRKS
jgi:hypothetical protein